MVPPIVISQSIYLTPRAILIQLLNEKPDERIAKWIVKNEIIEAEGVELFNRWMKEVRPSICDDFEYFDVNYNQFFASFSATIDFEGFCPSLERFKIITKASDKRRIVDDMTVGPLYEWLIRFLLEQTRIDWIDWTDKDKKEFQIFDLAEIGKMYAKVNMKSDSASLYHIKLILSGYCSTKILTQIDKKSGRYQFNPEWYDKEIKKKIDVTITEDDMLDDLSLEGRAMLDSFLQFPEQTLPVKFHYLERRPHS